MQGLFLHFKKHQFQVRNNRENSGPIEVDMSNFLTCGVKNILACFSKVIKTGGVKFSCVVPQLGKC